MGKSRGLYFQGGFLSCLSVEGEFYCGDCLGATFEFAIIKLQSIQATTQIVTNQIITITKAAALLRGGSDSSRPTLPLCISPRPRQVSALSPRKYLTRMFHEPLAATLDTAVLLGVLGCRLLRRTVQVRLGTSTLRFPSGTTIFKVSQHQLMKDPG